MMPILVHVPRDSMIEYQWQSPCGYYLAGFHTREAAERYGRMMGYLCADVK